MNIVWIDDDDSRRGESKNLEHRLGASVKFISSANNEGGIEMEEAITNLRDNLPPDLVLMDHTLTNSNSDTLRNGPSVIFMLKEVWKGTPFVGVSGGVGEITPFERRAYQAIIPFKDLRLHDSLLTSIAKGASEISSANPKDLGELFDLMKVPAIDRKRLEKIRPDDLDSEWEKPDVAMEVYRWLSNLIFSQPGFLYDKLWTSTHLGLNESGFDKVSYLFKDAKYSGVYCNDSDPRWWKSELVRILMDNVDEFGLPWELGRKLEGLSAEDFSLDEQSPNDIPEVVAYEDEISSNRFAMCLKNTVLHPNHENKLFFEEIRMQKA